MCEQANLAAKIGQTVSAMEEAMSHFLAIPFYCNWSPEYFQHTGFGLRISYGVHFYQKRSFGRVQGVLAGHMCGFWAC